MQFVERPDGGRLYLEVHGADDAAPMVDHVRDDLRHSSRQSPGAAARQGEAIRRFDAYDRFPEIDLPTLVLHRGEDRVVHPDNAQILAARIPAARLAILEGAGHVCHSERAADADGAVLEFMRAVS